MRGVVVQLTSGDISTSEGVANLDSWKRQNQTTSPMKVYMSGAGWITFDPTNRSVGGFNLTPIGVARDFRQAMPMSGSFIGLTDALGKSMEVSVAS